MAMEYTEEQLNNFDKSTLIQLFLVPQSELKDIDAKLGGGNTPYCYRYDKNLGYLVPIPERAEQANRAMDLFIGGI